MCNAISSQSRIDHGHRRQREAGPGDGLQVDWTMPRTGIDQRVFGDEIDLATLETRLAVSKQNRRILVRP